MHLCAPKSQLHQQKTKNSKNRVYVNVQPDYTSVYFLVVSEARMGMLLPSEQAT